MQPSVSQAVRAELRTPHTCTEDARCTHSRTFSLVQQLGLQFPDIFRGIQWRREHHYPSLRRTSHGKPPPLHPPRPLREWTHGCRPAIVQYTGLAVTLRCLSNRSFRRISPFYSAPAPLCSCHDLEVPPSHVVRMPLPFEVTSTDCSVLAAITYLTI